MTGFLATRNLQILRQGLTDFIKKHSSSIWHHSVLCQSNFKETLATKWCARFCSSPPLWPCSPSLLLSQSSSRVRDTVLNAACTQCMHNKSYNAVWNDIFSWQIDEMWSAAVWSTAASGIRSSVNGRWLSRCSRICIAVVIDLIVYLVFKAKANSHLLLLSTRERTLSYIMAPAWSNCV